MPPASPPSPLARGQTNASSPKKNKVPLVPPNRTVPKTYKPPWDFSGPDPRPREFLHGPPEGVFLTPAKLLQSVRKAIQRARYMQMRTDKAWRVAEGVGEKVYQHTVSAEKTAADNPNMMGLENGAAIEETRVMLTVRERTHTHASLASRSPLALLSHTHRHTAATAYLTQCACVPLSLPMY